MKSICLLCLNVLEDFSLAYKAHVACTWEVKGHENSYDMKAIYLILGFKKQNGNHKTQLSKEMWKYLYKNNVDGLSRNIKATIFN